MNLDVSTIFENVPINFKHSNRYWCYVCLLMLHFLYGLVQSYIYRKMLFSTDGTLVEYIFSLAFFVVLLDQMPLIQDGAQEAFLAHRPVISWFQLLILMFLVLFSLSSQLFYELQEKEYILYEVFRLVQIKNKKLCFFRNSCYRLMCMVTMDKE